MPFSDSLPGVSQAIADHSLSSQLAKHSDGFMRETIHINLYHNEYCDPGNNLNYAGGGIAPIIDTKTTSSGISNFL
jgi:hypothetical protein